MTESGTRCDVVPDDPPAMSDEAVMAKTGKTWPEWYVIFDERGEREIGISTGANTQEIMKINMEVHSVEGFSAHSSRKQLLNFLFKCMPKPKKVIINHGEASRCLDLASAIHKVNKVETVAPRNLETVRLK